MVEIIKHINENVDSLSLGSATKGGIIKIYSDYNNPIEFKKKIDNAKEVREYAQAKLAINI